LTNLIIGICSILAGRIVTTTWRNNAWDQTIWRNCSSCDCYYNYVLLYFVFV